MLDMDKDGNGPSIDPLGHYVTLCMGYEYYKVGS